MVHVGDNGNHCHNIQVGDQDNIHHLIQERNEFPQDSKDMDAISVFHSSAFLPFFQLFHFQEFPNDQVYEGTAASVWMNFRSLKMIPSYYPLNLDPQALPLILFLPYN